MHDAMGHGHGEAANDEDFRLRGLYLCQLQRLCALTRAHWKGASVATRRPLGHDVDGALRQAVQAADASAERICTHDSLALMAVLAHRMQAQAPPQRPSADVHLLLRRRDAHGHGSA